jgi:hypothetical protein
MANVRNVAAAGLIVSLISAWPALADGDRVYKHGRRPVLYSFHGDER